VDHRPAALGQVVARLRDREASATTCRSSTAKSCGRASAATSASVAPTAGRTSAAPPRSRA
jgi:hypothetical protein